VRTAVERWAVGAERSKGCLARTIDVEVTSESGEDDNVRGPFFGTLRCHSSRLYVRIAVALLAPIALINFILLGLRSKISFLVVRRKRR
jgi:hypothetical protein